MFSFILNFINNVNKSIKKSVATAKAKRELAQAKKSGDKEAEKQAKKKVRNASSGKTGGSFLLGITSKAAALLESIPVTLVAVKIIAVVLAIAIFGVILFSALSALSTVLLESTIAEVTSLGFTNPYLTAISQENYLDSDGAYHTIIRKVTEDDGDDDDDDDDDPDNPEVYTTDVELWLKLSDAQIYTYLDKAGYTSSSTYSMSDYVYAANWLRAVRMAYRICYAYKDKSEDTAVRIFRGIEPEILLGMIIFEKGGNWLGLSSEGGYGLTTEWISFATSNTQVTDNNPYANSFKTNSIDVAYSDLFTENVDGLVYENGPLSYSYFWQQDNFDEWFIKLLDTKSEYRTAYKNLLQYTEYSGMSSFLAADASSFTKPDTAIMTLFYSMFFCAMNYDSGAAAGGSPYWDGTLEDKGDGVYKPNRTCVVDMFTYNTSDYFWDTVGDEIYGASKDSGDIIGVLMCANSTKYSDVSEIPFEDRFAMTKQIINCMYYSTFHHYPDFNSLYDDYAAPTLGSLYDHEDYRAAMIVLTFVVVNEADGNMKNWYMPEVRDTYNVTRWTPWNGKGRDDYKYVISGIYTNNATDTTDFGWDSFKEAVTHGSSSKASLKRTNDKVLRIYATTNSLLGHLIDDKIPAEAIDGYSVIDFIDPILFQSHLGSYDNMHNMNVEGFADVISGGDIIIQLTDFVLKYSGSSVQPTDPPADLGIISSEFMLSTALSKAEPILMGGSACKLNDDGTAFTTNTERMYFPVVDMDNTKTGYNAYKGSGDNNSNNDQMYANFTLTQPIGEYMGGGVHNAIDVFGIGTAGGRGPNEYDYVVNYTSDEATTAFGSAIMGSDRKDTNYHNSNAFKDGTTLNERTAVVSIADGFITYIEYNKTTVDHSNGTSGNCVYVKYNVAFGSTIKEIYMAYMHLSPDFMLALSESLRSLGGKYSEGADTLEDLYVDNWDGTNTRKTAEVNIPIKQGTLIGFAGLTGATSGAHLHFGAYILTSSGYVAIWKDDYGGYDNGEGVCYMLFGAKAYGWKDPNDKWHYPFCYVWARRYSHYCTPKETNESGYVTKWEIGAPASNVDDLIEWGFGDPGIYEYSTGGGYMGWSVTNLPSAIENAKNHASGG